MIRTPSEQAARSIQSPRTFRERYQELADIGVRDIDMPKRLGMTAESLARMMAREGFTPSPLLTEIAKDRKRA